MFVLAKGEALRLHHKDGVEHNVDTKTCGTTINSLHLPMEVRDATSCYMFVEMHLIGTDDIVGSLLCNSQVQV
jgi:hypothetical protein